MTKEIRLIRAGEVWGNSIGHLYLVLEVEVVGAWNEEHVELRVLDLETGAVTTGSYKGRTRTDWVGLRRIA